MRSPESWPTLYFDADGVLVDEIDRGVEFEQAFGSRWTSAHTMSEFRVGKGVRELVARIHAKKCRAIIITNKPALANGEMLWQTHEAMCKALLDLGFDNIYACPHAANSDCECRKPKPGLLLQASRKWNSPLQISVFVGDRETDLLAARAAGCRGILLDTPRNRHVQAQTRIMQLNDILRFV